MKQEILRTGNVAFARREKQYDMIHKTIYSCRPMEPPSILGQIKHCILKQCMYFYSFSKEQKEIKRNIIKLLAVC